MAQGGVPQGYQADEALQNGMIVRLAPGNDKKVQAITQKDESDMFGVVVPASGAAVSLSNTAASKEVFIANSGQYEVVVSTQNGPINSGDYIAVSSLSGIGMRAADAREYVLGKALTSFDGKSDVEGNTVLKTSEGDKTIALGRVSIEVSVAHNPLYQEEHPAGVPDFLSQAAKVVTDEPVSAFRIYASLVVIVICILVAGIILVAGVRSGMIAVGRNPLAKKSISRNLLQVLLMALIVFVIGVIAVYLLLRV